MVTNNTEEHIADLEKAVYWALTCHHCPTTFSGFCGNSDTVAEDAYDDGWRSDNEAMVYCPACAVEKKL